MPNIFSRIGQWLGDEAASPASAQPEFDPDSTWDRIDGQPMDKRGGASPFDVLGTTGASTVGGFIISEDRGPNLQGAERYKAYREALLDTTIIAAGVRLFITLIRKAEWAALPAEGEEDSAEAKEKAELTYSMMFDMVSSWSTMVGKLAMFRFEGARLLEWTAKRRDDGLIGIDRAEVRPMATIVRWILDEGGNVEAVVQQDPLTVREVPIPREKLIYGVDDVISENPEGTGLLRHLVKTAKRLRGFLELEEVGYETDLRGIPVASVPIEELDKKCEEKGNTPAAKAARSRFLQPFLNFINAHNKNKRLGILKDSQPYRNADETQSPSQVRKWDVELLQGESTSFDAMAKAIDRMNQEMARVLGVEHLLLGADGGGSLALGKGKIDVLFLTVQSLQSELVEILERDWLGPIADLNGWDPKFVPSLAVAELRKEDVESIAEVLAKLAQAGAMLIPNDPVVAEIREMMDLPLPPEDLLDINASLLGNDPTDPGAPLPEAVAAGAEPFLIIGAIAGG